MNNELLEFMRRIYRNNLFNEKLGLKRTWRDFNGYHTTLTFNKYTVVTLLS